MAASAMWLVGFAISREHGRRLTSDRSSAISASLSRSTTSSCDPASQAMNLCCCSIFRAEWASLMVRLDSSDHACPCVVDAAAAILALSRPNDILRSARHGAFVSIVAFHNVL